MFIQVFNSFLLLIILLAIGLINYQHQLSVKRSHAWLDLIKNRRSSKEIKSSKEI